MADPASEIDVALTLLCCHLPQGSTLTQGDIADVCGCSRTYIDVIEKKAIKKLKAIAQRHGIRDYWEIAQ